MTDATLLLTLTDGPLRCDLAPHLGGAIAALSFTLNGVAEPLMRPATEEALRDGPANKLPSFPLVPFSNRIGSGRFAFGGHDVTLPVMERYQSHAIHGFGWQAPWEVTESGATHAVLTHRHAAGAWPWTYEAVQTVRVSADTLSLTMRVCNRSADPMPAGIGFHPYFPKRPGSRLTARAGSVWFTHPNNLPSHRTAIPPEWDFSGGLVVDDMVVDQGFPGWDGHAAIEWPDPGLRLTMDADPAYGHIVIYFPAGGTFFCAEPVSHMTDAVNRPDEPDNGMVTLAPGESLEGSVVFRVEAL